MFPLKLQLQAELIDQSESINQYSSSNPSFNTLHIGRQVELTDQKKWINQHRPMDQRRNRVPWYVLQRLCIFDHRPLWTRCEKTQPCQSSPHNQWQNRTNACELRCGRQYLRQRQTEKKRKNSSHVIFVNESIITISCLPGCQLRESKSHESWRPGKIKRQSSPE